MNNINGYKLSPAQQSILMAEQYYEGKPVNNICFIVNFPDADIVCLTEAVNDFIEHTQSLRMVVRDMNVALEKAEQYICEYEYEDIPVYSFAERNEEYDEFLKTELTRIIDIEKKMYRFYIITLSDGSADLIAVVHHLSADGFACGEATKAITANYRSILEGKEPTAKFDDYTDYLLNSEAVYEKSYERNKKFWNSYLEKPFSPAKLTDTDTSDIWAKRTIYYLTDKEKDILDKLTKLSHQTVVTVLMSLYGLYFLKTGDSDRIAMGSPFLNRTNAGERKIFGLFATMLPFIFDIEECSNFIELCNVTGSRTISLLRHQRFSYTEIQSISEKNHGLSGKLYNVMFNYIPLDLNSLGLVDWLHNGTSEYELCIHATEFKKGHFKISYDHITSVISEKRVERLHKAVFTMAENILKNINKNLRDIPVASELTEECYRRLNDTAVETDTSLTVADLFERQRSRKGDAVVCGNEVMSWEKFFEITDIIAVNLMKKGAGADKVVAVCMDRGINFICTVFGIIKSGAVFLPMDIDWPENRKKFVIDDSDAFIVITDENYSELVTDSGEEYHAPVISADDICYMIYTSGSTGTPKGVMLTHKNAVNFSLPLKYNYLVKEINNRCSDVLLLGNLAFDISVSEYFPAILNGKRLVIARTEELNSIRKLAECIISNHVDCIQCTPSRLIEYIEDSDFATAMGQMKVIMAAAEVFPEALYKRLCTIAGNAVILNGYGPTETTMGVSYSYVSDKKVTIGKPISNVSMYIMNRFGNLLDPMFTGELCICGRSVGRGYSGLPELTAKSFSESSEYGRMYRTGDLARLNEDGEIEFCGRIDRQIKLHGLRIEISEIENRMMMFKGIDMAVVRVIGSGKTAYLAGYYVSSDNINEELLKEELSKELTYYMIPSVFMHVDEIPKTPNGKADYSKLPEPENNYVIIPCENSQQEKLSAVISRILGTDKFGITTNLFRAGLTSLLTLKLNSEIATQFNVDIGSDIIMKNPTVQAIDKAIDNAPKIVRVNSSDNDVFSLNGGQLGIWLECANEKDRFNYHIPARLVFSSAVEPVKLAEAVKKAVSAHPYLMAGIKSVNGEPVLYKRDIIPEVNVIESNSPVEEEFVKPFDITKDVLFRATVYYNENTVCLCIDVHHIICDGYSLNILMKDIESCYNGGNASRELVSGFELAVAEADRKKSNSSEKSLAYYDSLFSGVESVSTVRAVLNEDYHTEKTVSVHMSKELFRAVENLAEKLGVTSANVVLSATELLISIYTRSYDVIIAVAENGRNTAGSETACGMFVKTLMLRIFADPMESVSDFIKNSAENLYDNISNDIISYSELTERFGLIPEIMFASQNFSTDDFCIIDESCKMAGSIHSAEAKFPISFDAVGNSITIEYDSGRYDSEFMNIMLDSCLNILERMTAQPDAELSQIVMASDSDLEKIARFNDTKDEFSLSETVVSVFERAVKANGNSLSFVATDCELTYDELDRKSNRVANALIIRGVSVSDIVIVRLPRTSNVIVAFLGVLKAGCAYLPLDTEIPEERAEYIRKDSGAVFEINPETVEILLAEENDTAPSVEITGNDLCYVIYTSGSTGIPKGVLVEHRNVLNYALDLKYNHQIHTIVNECNASVAVGNLSFDIAVAEIYPFLLSGKPVVLADEEEVFDAGKLASKIEKYAVDFILCTPTRLLQYIENPDFAKALSGFRSISSAGEKVTEIWLNSVRKLSSAKLYNGYGPTETTAGCTFKEIVSDEINIGVPLSNVQAHVLDMNMNPVPIGVSGELCITGMGVTRGYLNRPELTEKAYVDNNFSDGKMYRTGDIVFWTKDGNLQYIGRADNQIKLRGFRIELSEIEKVICTAENVDACAVTVKGSGNKAVLCAYVASQAGADETSLKEYISGRLTSYMIPSVFVFVDKMPMNSNGKIDVKALEKIKTERKIVPCNTDMQRKIAETVSEILDCGEIGITDDLYSLGLTSLLAMKLAWRLQEMTGTVISSKSIMKCSDIKDIETLILSSEHTENIADEDIRTFYPLTDSQFGIYTEYDKNRQSVSYNMPMLYSFRAGIDINRLSDALKSAVDAHPYLKSSIIKKDGAVSVRRKDGAVPVIDIFSDMPDDYNKLIRPFDLENDSLYRLEIYSSENETLLFMDFHHIIFDGASATVFLEDVKRAYEGLKIEPEIKNTFSYSLQNISKEKKENSRNYFHELFSGAEEGSKIFADKQDEGKPTASYISEEIPESVITSAVNASCKYHVTVADVFFTAFLLTVSKYGMNPDVAVGTVESGRENSDYRRSIGMFVRTLPFFIRTQKDETIADFIARVHNTMLSVSEHTDYAYTDFVADFGISLETHFVYNEETSISLDFGGIKATEIPLLLKDPKFALTMNISGKNIAVDYRSDLYEKAVIRKFINSVMYCVKLFDEQGNTSLGNLSIASEHDMTAYRLLNNTDVDSPYTTMDRMFAEAVKNYSDRVAVVCGSNDSLTYKQLGETAERIAVGLKNKGIGKNDVVAFCLPRGIGIIKAIFGIIRAGSAILPIDITWPEERISYVMENSGAKLLITTEVLSELESNNPEDAPVLDVTPDDLSYVIYTSGSTGRPKGAMLIQRNLTNFLKPLEHNCLVSEMYRKCKSILSISNVTFDISICEIFPAVFYGRKLAFADDRAFDSPRILSEFALKHNVDCIQGTPSRISQYLEEPDFCRCLKNVRVMLVAGESLNHALTDRLKELSDTVILNGYGPTETTLAASYQYVSEKKITIGRPVANAKMYIVDKWLNLQPQGCVGELCIGGCNVGIGYINRDDLTKEKFVRNPFHSGTLYHSGDLARLTDDGEIDFLGRMDNQIKLHGLRIELDEIESVMSAHPLVTACAVKAVGSGKTAYLCGYYTASDTLAPDTLKDYLRKRLTYYMVPSILVKLDVMPISTAGKIDRQNLPAIDVDEELIPCETKLQEEIKELVCRTLDNDRVGINTDLFRLGLTSLLAVKLSASIYNKFGAELSSMDILKNNTIALLEQLVSRHMQTDSSAIPVEKKNEYSLTDAQMGVYLESVKNTEDMKYNIPSVYIFDRSINPEKLADACVKAVKAHSYLNCFLKETDTAPVMVRNDDYIPEIKVVYCNEPEKADFVKPFDLTKPPLYRMEIRYNDDKVYLYSDFHHIIFDGESLDIFMQDVKLAYEGNELSGEKYTSFDYAMLREGSENSDRDYYLQLFDGVSSVSSIHSDINETGRSLGREERIINKEQYNAIKNFAVKNAVSVSSVMTSAYQLVISRLTRRNEVVSATIWDGRNDVRFSESVGMFVRTLPVYIKLEKDEKAFHYISRVQQAVYLNAEHDRFSYAQFCSETGLIPELLYVYQNHAEEKIMIGDSEIDSMFIGTDGLTSAKFPITLNIIGQKLIIEYDSGRYYPETAKMLLDMFSSALEGLINPENIRVADICLANESEIEKIRKFNATETDFPEGETIVSLFEKQVSETPDITALIGSDRELTYKELDCNANRIANSLIEKGISKGDIVAVLLPRTTDIITAFLGIMKAGAVYLPLDINYPQNRIDYYIEDSGARIMVDESNIQELMMCENTNAPCLPLSTDDLCYIIYTSGSTGKPKGVMAKHRGVINYSLPLEYNYHARTIADKCSASLAIGSLAFDIAVAEIYPFLLTGKTVVLVDGDSSNDPAVLAEIMKKYSTDALLCTPSRLLRYIEYKPFADALKNFRSISAAGEAVPLSWLRKLRELTDAKLYNGYGPTETTAGSVFLEMNDDYVNIGHPLSNEKVYIVDTEKNLLPVGAVGELCITGYGVSAGYLNRPELTDERFIDVPYACGKMYCTGDLAKWNERGEIEYIGRMDSQVKYHGYRIEIGEIEEVIGDYDGIVSCAVVLRNINDSQYMFAYFTAEKTVDISELKKYMASVIPSYMIPTAFMQMKELPLDMNSKIDRRSLPDIDFISEKNYVAPANDAEKALCEVFAQVLGLERVSADASFFEMGGDSIKGIQVASKIIEYGYRMKMRQLFASPSAREMADYLTPAGIIAEEKIEGETPLSAIQSYFFTLDFADKHYWNQSVQLSAKERIDMKVLNDTLDIICRHHDELRADFIENNGTISQVIAPENAVGRFTVCETTEENAETQMQTASESMKLDGCKVYAVVIHCSENDKLFITVHHTVVDTVSWRIILEDLENIYTAKINGREYTLPAKTSSYRKYAEEQHRFAESYIFRKEQEYWKKADSENYEIIPADNILSGTRIAGNRRKERIIPDKNICLAVKNAVAKDNGIEMNDILTTAVMLALNEMFGIRKTSVLIEGHGREDFSSNIDISRTVGWFTDFCIITAELCDDNITTLYNIKEKLHSIPQNGFSYTIDKYISGSELNMIPELQINYLGEFGNETKEHFFRFDEIGQVSDFSSESPCVAKLEVSGYTVQDRMVFDAEYDMNEYRPETIRTFIELCSEKLAELSEELDRLNERIYTPSDFDCEGINSSDWQNIIHTLGNLSDFSEICPASDMQSGMILLAEHYRERSYYHEQLVMVLPFAVDTDDFYNRLCRCVERHSVLRTLFISNGMKTTYQAVLRSAEPDFEFKDVTNYSRNWEKGNPLTKVMQRYFETYLKNDREKGFVPHKNPMFRTRLFKAGEDAYILMLSFSHVILDKWSTDNLLGELLGREEISTEKDNFSRYIDWLKVRDHNEASEFWKGIMKDAPDTAFPVSSTNTGKPVFSELRFSMDENIVNKLNEICKSEKVTPSTLMQTVFGRVVMKITNSSDVCFGYTYSGRPDELEHSDKMVGMFIHTLPVRLKKGMTLSEIQKLNSDIEKYSYISSSDIQRWSKLRHPAYRYFMTFQNTPDTEDNRGIYEVLNHNRSVNDFNLFVKLDKTLEVMIEFDSDKFTEEFVRELAECFRKETESFGK